jgi:F0F1-type ATP synthase membrane subunit b/b'
LTDYANDLGVENQRLARWNGVADADAKAIELLQTAQAALDKATSDAAHLTSEAQQHANTLITNARNDAITISTEARQQAKTLKDKANESLNSATSKVMKS